MCVLEEGAVTVTLTEYNFSAKSVYNTHHFDLPALLIGLFD